MIVFFFYSRRAMACSQAGLPTFPTWNIIIMHFSHLLLGSYENSRILYLLCFSVIAYGVLHEERVFRLPSTICFLFEFPVVNSSINILIYSCLSAKFRQEARSVFLWIFTCGRKGCANWRKKELRKRKKKHTKEYKFSLGNCVPVDMHYAHVRIRKTSYDLQKQCPFRWKSWEEFGRTS